MSAELLLACCMAVFVASIIPSPSMLLALAKGANHGWGAGALSGAGNIAAMIVQAVASYLMILEVGGLSSSLLLGMKLVGALYIFYIGWTLMGIANSGSDREVAARSGSSWQHVRDGFMFAVVNPKAIVFFAALFPQFVRRSAAGGVIAMGVPIVTIGFACFMIYVVAGRVMVEILGNGRHVGKIFGICIMLCALALLFARIA
ncbi:LysE family translocator [Sorangium sp. So ce124]|uniref:LysE family translocator n=1 Tax=Sorangium sp. So ce124 TaxID=3133280 RepID=UPI003F6130EA